MAKTIKSGTDKFIRLETELSTTTASNTPVIDNIELYQKGSIGYIDLKKKPRIPKLYLARPNGTVIAHLKEAYGINHNLKLGNVHELSFSLPYEIEKGNNLIRNANVDTLREKYLIKLVLGSDVQWYVISTVKEAGSDASAAKQITAMFLPYELRNKIHRIYNTDTSGSKNLTAVATDALAETLWSVGYVDASFDVVYRSFSIASQTALDFIFQIATTFKALIIWDSVNRTVNFYKQENVGINRGLVVSYYKYLKTLNKTVSSDELVTRLKVYGKNDLSIQRLNPTGTDYLEDFSFFLYPFQRDTMKNVLQSSNYMSNGLCNAILDYQDLVESKRGQFTTLAQQRTDKVTLKSQADTVQFGIDTDLAISKDNVDIQQADGTYNNISFTQTTGTTTNNLSLKASRKHAIMIYVSNMTGLAVSYSGTAKTVTSGTWTVIGKEDVPTARSVSVSVSGTGNASVQIISVHITDNEFIGAAYEGAKMHSTGLVLTTTDPNTDWKLVKSGDTVWIENGVQGGFQFSGTNSDFAGTVQSATSTSITLTAAYAAGDYTKGYLITTSNNDSVIVYRYNAPYQQSRHDTQQSVIDSINSAIAVIDGQIATLRSQISITTNFTTAQIKERNLFILEKEWADQNYIYDTDLYADAIKKFNIMKTPQTVIEIDVVNFLEVLEAQNDWDKLVLGDSVTVKYEKFNVNVKAKIIDISYDYEGGNIKLTIANVQEIETDEDKLIKMLYRSNSTSTTVDISKYKWSETAAAVGDIGTILQGQWDAAKRAIVAGVKEGVTIDARGITIADSSDPLNFLRATHGVLGITNDGGNTYKNAITTSGVLAERLFGQVIMSNNLIVGDADGILKFVGNKGYIYDRTGYEVMKLGLYDVDTTTGAEKFGLRLTTPNTKVIIDKDAGFQITRLNLGTWDTIAWLDTFGKLNLKDIIASGTIEAKTLSATTSLKVGNIDVTDLIANGLQANTNWIKANMIEANTITANQIKVGDLIVGTNVTMGPSATLSWGNVSGKPSDLAYLSNITWAQTSGKPVDLAYLSNIDWTRVKGTVMTQGGVETQMIVAAGALIGDALIGNLSASKINAGTLNAAYIATDIAQVASTVSIGGSSVRGRINLYTPGTARDTYIQAGTDPYSASQLNLVSDVIYLKSSGGSTQLQFAGGSTITFGTSTVDFTSTTVNGLSLTAKFG